MKISVVIPAYNEEPNIENMVHLLLNNFNRNIVKIIIVNDCSIDNTKQILNKLAKKYSKILPIHRESNKGVGNAIIEGLRKASKNSDHVLLLDCDFTNNVDNIKDMIKNIKQADGLLGSRYIKKNSLYNYPLPKKVANRIFHALIGIFLNVHYADVSNNFKLYKTEIIKAILPLLKSKGFSINAETGIYPILLGFKIKEIPVSWIGRKPDMGKTSFNVIKAGPGYIKVFFDVFKFKYFNNLKLKETKK